MFSRKSVRYLLPGDRVVLALEQFFRGLAPRAEVVFVEHHEVPVDGVEPLVLRLDVAGLVPAEQVLEGAEIDERPVGVGGRRVGPVTGWPVRSSVSTVRTSATEQRIHSSSALA
jgi:hypothetical protein